MRQDDIDRFGSEEYPIPPSCLISVYGSPTAVPSLHYGIPIEGVLRPVTIYIHRGLRNHVIPSSSGKSIYILLHEVCVVSISC